MTDSTLFLELGRLEVAAAKAERRGDREGFRDQESLRPGEREWGQEEIVSTMSDQTEEKNVILLLLDMSYAMADSIFEMMKMERYVNVVYKSSREGNFLSKLCSSRAPLRA